MREATVYSIQQTLTTMHTTLICSPQPLNSQLSATYLPTNHTIRLRSNHIRSVTAEPIERTLTKMQDENARRKGA